MDALAFYFGDGQLKASEESIYEIINQDPNPIGTIADALEDYILYKTGE